MLDNTQARALLERSLLSYSLEILGRSALLSAVLSLAYYLYKPKAFALADIWITFIVVVVFHSVLTVFGLLMAAGRHRKRPKGWEE